MHCLACIHVHLAVNQGRVECPFHDDGVLIEVADLMSFM
jgi:hypothetical protein